MLVESIHIVQPRERAWVRGVIGKRLSATETIYYVRVHRRKERGSLGGSPVSFGFGDREIHVLFLLKRVRQARLSSTARH